MARHRALFCVNTCFPGTTFSAEMFCFPHIGTEPFHTPGKIVWNTVFLSPLNASHYKWRTLPSDWPWTCLLKHLDLISHLKCTGVNAKKIIHVDRAPAAPIVFLFTLLAKLEGKWMWLMVSILHRKMVDKPKFTLPPGHVVYRPVNICFST